jgi:hypothetical protein
MSTTPTTRKNAAKTAAKAEPTQNTTSKLLAEARTEAVGQLLEAHRPEFNDLMEAAAAKRNVKWKRRPTEAEKREAKLRALLAEDPTLAEVALSIVGIATVEPEVVVEGSNS